MTVYPKRLIEVDLPIKRISEHARREKSIRHGHLSTLHIWWARRPLAACRAVICAALWPDPRDPLCPQLFRDEASRLINQFARKAAADKDLATKCSTESWGKWQTLTASGGLDSTKEEHWNVLRFALLDFIADFANWDNSTVTEYLEISRALTQVAHETLGGEVGTRPLVVDPFAGGGSIPFEALRVGADAFASDLNPVAVLLNKVILEYIPKYGRRLADGVRKWGDWIRYEAKKELAEFYPNDRNGSTPIAYLWARTIQCEGPGCGAELPLIRSLWLAKKPNRSVALQLVPKPQAKCVDFQVIIKQRDAWVDQANPKIKVECPKFDGTVKRGSATCPCCGYTTPVARVREQLKAKQGGTNDARLYCVVTTNSDEQGRTYSVLVEEHLKATRKASKKLAELRYANREGLSLVPEESTTDYHSFVNRGPIYGMTSWESYFTPRQLLALTTLVRLVRNSERLEKELSDGLSLAVQTCLAFVVDKMADKSSSLCRWKPSAEYMAGNTFGRQALPMVWDFCETNVFGNVTGDIGAEVEWIEKMLLHGAASLLASGHAELASATLQTLPNDAAQAFITDPPYYYSVQYGDLSDFFYVWLRRTIGDKYPGLLDADQTPKEDEIIVQSPGHQFAAEGKNNRFYENRMKAAMEESYRVLAPSGIGVVVFAHTSTSAWESQLQAMLSSGWIISGSWPIDTEMAGRVIAQGRSVLASSIHLVCRPREKPESSVRTDEIGDWRDVLQELPRRIHEWMPRLAEEGVAGADAIFACLGPALEIFSRYSAVEKASGESVTLKEYLEFVWAAVAKEALTIIFPDADTIAFEEDARLTAMWLWTLNAGRAHVDNGDGAEEEEVDDELEGEARKAKTTGFVLEYDAARKIAQGLGAHLEQLTSLVEVRGERARLLPVSERARNLFGNNEDATSAKRRGMPKQLSLLDVLGDKDEENTWGARNAPRVGNSVLDRIHQSMILFGASRGEALKRFLVTEGAGQDQRFWRLAQALSALYPKGTDERRWVEGVLARKKGLGF
jgi:putative DNA methylase